MKLDEYRSLQKRGSGSKYHNKNTDYNGRLYDSAREARHAQFLDTMKSAVPSDVCVVSWEPQVRFPIVVNGVTVCTYIADFVVQYADGHTEVQDVKSEYTKKLPVYRLKKKLMLASLGIKVVEI